MIYSKSNYSAIIILVAVVLLAASDQTLGHYPYPDPKPPKEDPKESANITCQDLGQICASEGRYKCCDKLVCRAPSVGDGLVCLPSLVPDTPLTYVGNPKCREILKICLEFGEYACCKGLSCVATSPVNPIGIGVCIPIIVEKPPTNVDECQKEHQLCEPYEKYNCCTRFKCIDLRTFTYPRPIDPAKVPPGVGICITKYEIEYHIRSSNIF